MKRLPNSLLVTIVGVIVAILAGIAYVVFSIPNGNFPGLPPLQEKKSSAPVSGNSSIVYPYTDSSSCATGDATKVASCCDAWAKKQSGLTIPQDCKVRWTTNAQKQCIYSCDTEAIPL